MRRALALSALAASAAGCRGRADRTEASVDARDGSVVASAGGNTVTVDSNGVTVVDADGRRGVTVSPTTVQVAGGAPRVTGMPMAVNGNNTNREFACNGGSFVVTGNHNTLTLRGRCGAVTVVGNENTVAADEVGAITTTGSDNRVTYRSGTGGGDPRISNVGSRNTVERG